VCVCVRMCESAMSVCSQGQNKQQKCTSLSSNSECRGEESGEGQYDRSREGKVEVNVAMAISCLISISLSISLHKTWENYTHIQPSQHTPYTWRSSSLVSGLQCNK